MQTSTVDKQAVKLAVEQHNGVVRRRRRKLRIAVWSVVAIVGLAIALPMISYTSHWIGSEAIAQEAGAATNPRSNYWRAVKEGVSGYSALSLIHI